MTYLLSAYLALWSTSAPENLLLGDLTTNGLPTARESGDRVSLPLPSMPDGLESSKQQSLIVDVAGPGRRLDLLLRDSIVAPFVLKISEVPVAAADAPLRRVDVSYVAYGPLECFAQPEFYLSLIDLAGADETAEGASRASLLGGTELSARRLNAVDSPERKVLYVHTSVELFDRVALQATRRIELTSGDESVVIAAVIDPSFTSDRQFPNQWRSLERAPQGPSRLGEPHPYSTSCSYTKVTQLQDPRGSLFIEHHLVFAEPNGWFGGKNMLRSKLPLVVQRSVRALRRRLKAP